MHHPQPELGAHFSFNKDASSLTFALQKPRKTFELGWFRQPHLVVSSNP
jgi:hypothetical protein